MPSMPSHCGLDAGNAPRPISVEVIGKPVNSANSRRFSDASGPELITPPPV
ncbi:hypothetical protein D3C71_2186130 [compost metagenome]